MAVNNGFTVAEEAVAQLPSSGTKIPIPKIHNELTPFISRHLQYINQIPDKIICLIKILSACEIIITYIFLTLLSTLKF